MPEGNAHEPTKAERREQKRRKSRRMGVSGRSVRQLQEIIRRKAEQADDKKHPTS